MENKYKFNKTGKIKTKREWLPSVECRIFINDVYSTMYDILADFKEIYFENAVAQGIFSFVGSTMKIKKIRDKSLFETVQVTEENIQDVAKWCRGSVKKNTILVSSDVYDNYTDETKAEIGDWIINEDNVWSVMTSSELKEYYDVIEEKI